MSKPQQQPEEESKEFFRRFRTVILATVDAESRPEASYAPYIEEDGVFYVFVSELASHTSNLLHQGKGSLLFIENEEDSANVFARKRLSLTCEAIDVGSNATNSDAKNAARILDLFAERFGPTIGMLRQLPDFHLIQLIPIQANFVRGFGQAFRFSGDRLK